MSDATAALLMALLGLAAPRAATAPDRQATAGAGPRRALTDTQFCTFARQFAAASEKMRGSGGPAGMRVETVSADCRGRRLTWTESAAAPLGAHQLAALRQNWNKAMCAAHPLRDAVLRGWTLSDRIKANGRIYEFNATCRAS